MPTQKKVKVDPKCIGCGTCYSMCPNTFKAGDDGKSQVHAQNVDEEEALQNAINSCPVQAISWDEGGEAPAENQGGGQ